MHGSVIQFISAALTPALVTGKRVLEVGSAEAHGPVPASVTREYVMSLKPDSYLGIDLMLGAGVDKVLDAADIPAVLGQDCADVVISAEMMEHALDWQGAMRGMILGVVPGGVLVVTTRSEGFPRHCPPDCWRYSTKAMHEILHSAGLVVRTLRSDPQDPGVFALARKPAGWKWPSPDWVDADVTPAPES